MITGVLAGLFGLGGAFLLTPLLLFLGVPVPVAIASQATQIVAASTAGALTHWGAGRVDIKLGVFLISGGLLGVSIGIVLFNYFIAQGQLETVIRFGYVVLLGIIGSVMLTEGLLSLRKEVPHKSIKRYRFIHHLMHILPFKVTFKKSALRISALGPISIGMTAGMLSSIMGIGGGFIIMPALIYILGVHTLITVGTSLLHIIFIMIALTIAHSLTNHSVDIVLATLLMFGATIGSYLGAAMLPWLKGEHFRSLLGFIVLFIALQFAWQLVTTPDSLWSFSLAPTMS